MATRGGVGLTRREQKEAPVESRPTFSEIKPLLRESQVDKERNVIRCVFVCPVTHRQVQAEAYIQQGSGFKDRLMDSASRSFWYELRYSVARTVSSLLPAGFMRDVVEGTAWRMAYAGDDKVDSTQELEQATVEAFLSVRHEFEREGASWRSREVVTEFVTDFEKLLRENPISTRYEGEILGRALGAMAAFDGLDQAERNFLADFLPGTGDGDTRPPSAVELAELKPEIKPTVYLLACTLTLVDQAQSTQEQDYLLQLQRDLQLDPERAKELRRASGQFIVEQVLGLNSQPTEEEIRQLAALAGLSRDEVERVMVRRHKRSLSS